MRLLKVNFARSKKGNESYSVVINSSCFYFPVLLFSIIVYFLMGLKLTAGAFFSFCVTLFFIVSLQEKK